MEFWRFKDFIDSTNWSLSELDCLLKFLELENKHITAKEKEGYIGLGIELEERNQRINAVKKLMNKEGNEEANSYEKNK